MCACCGLKRKITRRYTYRRCRTRINKYEVVSLPTGSNVRITNKAQRLGEIKNFKKKKTKRTNVLMYRGRKIIKIARFFDEGSDAERDAVAVTVDGCTTVLLCYYGAAISRVYPRRDEAFVNVSERAVSTRFWSKRRRRVHYRRRRLRVRQILALVIVCDGVPEKYTMCVGACRRVERTKTIPRFKCTITGCDFLIATST
jgi:hypothetical protein